MKTVATLLPPTSITQCGQLRLTVNWSDGHARQDRGDTKSDQGAVLAFEWGWRLKPRLEGSLTAAAKHACARSGEYRTPTIALDLV